MSRRRSRRAALQSSWTTGAALWLLALGLSLPWLGPPSATVAVDVLAPGAGSERYRVVVRGLAGPAHDLVWQRAANRPGRTTLKVRPGRLEVVLEAREPGGELRCPPVRVDLTEGRRAELRLLLGPSGGQRGAELSLSMPQSVWCTDEQPRFLLSGREPRSTEAHVSLERLDLDRLLAERGGTPWFSAWGQGIDFRDLRQLAPYLHLSAETTEPLAAERAPGEFRAYVKLAKLPPGGYLATVSVDGLAVRHAFQVTDLALVTKSDGRRLLALACALRTGAVWPGAAVQLLGAQGRPLWAGVAGANGLADLALPAGAGRERVVLARSGPHLALTKLHVPAPGDDHRTIHLYTDRPVYRPGQTVHVKALVRDRTPGGWVLPRAGLPWALQVNDGRGQPITKLRGTTSTHGTFHDSFEVPEAAFTGEFELEASVDGSQQSLSVPVKAYVKPVYKVKLSGPQEPLVRGARAEFQVAAEYFFGSAVGGAEVHWSVGRRREYGLPGRTRGGDEEPWLAELYREPDEDRGDGEGSGEDVLSGTGRLDDTGKLTIALPTADLLPVPGDAAPRDEDGRPVVPESTDLQRLGLTVHVLDGTGRDEQASAGVTVAPAPLSLAIDLAEYDVQVGHQVRPRLKLVDLQGRPLAGRAVAAQLYRTNWVLDCRQRWVDSGPQPWVRPQLPLGAYGGCPTGGVRCPYDHAGRRLVTLGAHYDLSTDERGEVTLAFTPRAAGEWTVVATALDDEARLVRESRSVYVQDEAVPDYRPLPDGARLELRGDRPRYRLGDQARVVARGERVTGAVLLTHEGEALTEPQVVTCEHGAARGQLTVGAADLPNATVAGATVRDKQLVETTRDLHVDLAPRRLDVQVTCSAAHAQPREVVTYTVTTRCGGQPVDAEVSLAVVDESLFAIAEQHPERAVLAFYGRHDNRVQTWFSAPSQYFEASKDRAGPVRRYFPDTALWQPCLSTGPTGTVTAKLRLPDSLTTWRATAIALSDATQVGFGTTRTLVSKPLMVRLETPRFLTQRDLSQLTAAVHNETDARQSVDLRLNPGGLIQDGSLTRSVSVPAHGRAAVAWPVRAFYANEAVLTASASTPTLHDAVEKRVPVVPYAFVRTLHEQGRLPAGTPRTLTFDVPGDTVREATRFDLTIAASSAGTIAAAIDGLVDFPYGCVEQTTSRYVGCLVATRAYQALGWALEAPVAPRAVQRHVRDGLLRIRRLQHDQGGWGWFEGQQTDPYMTAYALWGLQQAKAAGYTELAGPLLEAGLNRLAELVRVRTAGQLEMHELALAAEVLAEAQRPEAHLALRPLLDGQRRPTIEQAARAWLAARRLGVPAELQAATAIWRKRCGEADWAQASVGDLAWAIRVQLRDAAPPTDLVERLQQRFAGGQWVCTRDTCLAVAALTEYLERTGADAVTGRVDVALNGRPLQPFTFDGRSAKGRGAVYKLTGGPLVAGRNTVTLSLTGSGQPQFACSLALAIGGATLPARGGNVNLTRTYERVVRAHFGGWNYLPLGDLAQLGSVLRVRLGLTARQSAEHLLLVDPLPAGCEPLDQGEQGDDWSDLAYRWYAHKDTRDDHVAFFFDRLGAGEPRQVSYLLRASVPGDYQALPPRIEPMYHPQERSTGADSQLRIR